MDQTNLINKLLERYLHLLDDYTRLRADLARLQSRMHQDIARANFAAERGVRYDAAFYDSRAKPATRLLSIAKMPSADGEGLREGKELRLRFEVVDAPESDDDVGSKESGDMDDDDEEREEKELRMKAKRRAARDPMRWFGFTAPLALRHAQANAVELVRDIVPRLVEVDAEMKSIEIEIGRARKRRAKAEANAAKAGKAEGQEEGGSNVSATS